MVSKINAISSLSDTARNQYKSGDYARVATGELFHIMPLIDRIGQLLLTAIGRVPIINMAELIRAMALDVRPNWHR
jgi:hypothetical protein